MNHLSRIFLPATVRGLGIFSDLMVMATEPEATLHSPTPALPVVETHIVQPQNYQVLLRTQGTVIPRTQSTLIPEVAGRICFYLHQYFVMEVRSLRVKPFWWLPRRITRMPSLLPVPTWRSLRHIYSRLKPIWRVPEFVPLIAGRVLEKRVDVGQYVAPGTVAATIYAMDAAEVRLPLTDSQLAFVDLPGFGEQNRKHQAAVTLSHRVGNVVHQWQGRLVRTDGAVDTTRRQLFVVVQIDNPFQYKKQHKKQSDGNVPPLKIGQFVEADI